MIKVSLEDQDRDRFVPRASNYVPRSGMARRWRESKISKQNEGLYPQREFIENPELPEGGYYGVRWKSAESAFTKLAEISDGEKATIKKFVETEGAFIEQRERNAPVYGRIIGKAVSTKGIAFDMARGNFFGSRFLNPNRGDGALEELVSDGNVTVGTETGIAKALLLAMGASEEDASARFPDASVPDVQYDPETGPAIESVRETSEWHRPWEPADIGMEYAFSQAILKEIHGDKPVKLYRGVSHPDTIAQLEDATLRDKTYPYRRSLQEKSLSYWTTDYQLAEDFAMGEFVGREKTEGKGYVVSAEMPQWQILGSPLSQENMSDMGEQEHVVLSFAAPISVHIEWSREDAERDMTEEEWDSHMHRSKDEDGNIQTITPHESDRRWLLTVKRAHKLIDEGEVEKQEGGDGGTVVTVDDVSSPTYGRSKSRKRKLWVE